MKLWQRWRTPLLIFTFVNVLFVSSRVLLDSNIGKRKVTPFTFPATVPLPQWQQVASQPLPDRIVEQEPYGKVAFPGKRYQYKQNNLLLDVDTRYELNTVGDGQQAIADNLNLSFPTNRSPLQIRRDPQLGDYAVFVHQQKAYLNACINSRGGSTFTPSQFDSNRLRYDFQFPRIALWLLGRQELRDNRCIWTHLSLPLKQPVPEAYSTLEQAWFSWYKWWSSRFSL
ncbi:cyanoexosortase A system-associated protein [Scytonema millei]|uniref:Cyanoexosortase A system-associated protein n=1 Tax=Scytonema millei VB511283 TaxID=1245923 RepID=A0A9X5E8A6_9CYAN|nr:cyanoexosortase A system-associated protein [Scytonema millei]NHC37205.1 cyanoexosortase A system-associated protein [Scytonema millei VB511283]